MKEQLVNAEILNLLNEKREVSYVLEQVCLKLKNYLQCEAVGIRMKDKLGNVPYASHAGFSDKFLKKENFICVRTDHCACIEIIEGEYDSVQPLYTPFGSFFTNNLQSLRPVRDGMISGRFRGECVRSGWECLAIIPVRYAHEYFGAIHAVHPKTDGIKKRQVQFIENIASQLGLYLHGIEIRKEREEDFSAIVRTIIHDLRSPLTSIKGFSELITYKYSEELKKDVPDMVDRILRNAEYIEHLVQGLGEFAHSTEKAEEYFEKITLKELISDLVSDMDIPRKGEMRIEIAENIPEFDYPRFSLKRVLSNLITNAVKYTPEERQPVIKIGCKEKDMFYQVSVQDNGMGIEENELDKIFHPLYRSIEVKNVRGSGLGLSICKRLIEKNGGKLRVYSDKGEGSVFYFTIPKLNS